MGPQPRIAFRVLGPLALFGPDGPVEIGGARRRTLLAVLLARRGEVVSVDRLLEEVWLGDPPTRARDTLQAHLAHLRKTLAAAAPDTVIERQAPGYVLSLPDEHLDIARFDELVSAGRRSFASGDAASSAKALGAALDLWSGDAYDGVHDAPSIQAERTRLEQLCRDAVEDWAEAELTLGRPDAVIGSLESLLASDPWRERATGQLMLAFYRSGRQVDAIETYERLRRALADELGLVPSPELRALETEIMRQEPGTGSPVPHADPSEPREVLPFVGRADALSTLVATLRRAARGEKVVALVRGESGAGKTRLVRELTLSGPAHGVTVLFGRCDEDPTAPYQPFLEAIGGHVDRAGDDALYGLPARDVAELARVVPRLAGSVPGAEQTTTSAAGFERLHFFEAVTAFLRSLAPALLVLDDMHAADPASLALLQHLLRSPADVPVCVVMTTRDDEPGSHAALDAVASAQREGIDVVNLALSGIDKVAVEALVRATIPRLETSDREQLAGELWQATDGNPFFVRELLHDLRDRGREAELPADIRAGGAELPVTVRDAIGSRVGRLSDEARKSLSAAAVIGQEFDLDVLAAVVSSDEQRVLSHVERAREIGVVVETPTVDRFRFAHALHRWVIHDQLTASRRARLHHLVGTAIERLREETISEHLAELADHFGEAAKVSDASAAVTYSQRAGDHAMGLLAYEEAAQHFRRAVDGLSFMAAGDDELRCSLLLRLADALNRSGDLNEASQVLSTAAMIASRLGDADRLASAALLYGGTMSGPVDIDWQQVALLEQALELVGTDRPALRARVMARLSTALEYATSERALELAADAVAFARASGDDRALAAALYANVNLHFVDGSGGERLAEVTELAGLATDVGDVDLELMAEAWRIVRLLELGDATDADDVLADMVERASQLRQPFFEWGAAGFQAMHALLRGEFEDAEAFTTGALSIGQRVHAGQALQAHVVQLLAIRYWQGRLAEIAPILDGIDSSSMTLPGWQAIQVWVPFQIGDEDTTRARLDELRAVAFTDVMTGPFWGPATALVAEACAAFGEPDDARLLYDRLLPLADEAIVVGRASVCLGAAAYYLGLLASRLGRIDDADAHFERATDLNVLMGARPYVALTRYEHARLMRARSASGDAEQVAAIVKAARLEAKNLGVHWLDERLQALDVPARI